MKMIEKFSGFSLKKKIISTFNIINVSAFLCIFVIVMLSFRSYLNKHYELITNSNLKQASTLLVNHIDNMESCAGSFYMNEKARSVFEKYLNHSEEDFYKEYFDYLYLVDAIRIISSEYEFDISCYVNENFGYVSDESIVRPLSSAMKFYENRRKEPIYVIDKKPDGKRYVAYIRPIMRNNSFTEVAGFIQIDLPIKEIEKILESINLYDETIAYLNTDNTIVVYQNDEISCRKADFVESIKEDNNYFQYNYDIPGTQWSIGVLSPKNIYMQLGRRLVILFALILVAMIVILYKLITIFISSITSRIDYITESFERGGESDLPQLINSNPADDIGKLIDAYNTMIIRIEQLTKTEEKLRLEYEMRLLQEQINPHFLYNCLASVSGLIMNGQQKDSLVAVKLLSDFYKKNLHNYKKIISIKTELDITNIYFEMQQICNSKQMILDIDIDETIYGFSIPKMTLQPIVENAIIHGILPANDEPDKNSILIVGYVEDEYIYLNVSDNGVGMKKDKINQIQNNSVSRRIKGIGLKNIDERIKILYGEDCGLLIESEPDEYTSVTVKIKKILCEGDIL